MKTPISPQRRREFAEVHREDKTLPSLWTSAAPLRLCAEFGFAAKNARSKLIRASCLLFLLFLSLGIGAQNKSATQSYLVDPSLSRIHIALKQEGFMSRKYSTHLVVVKDYKIKIERAADDSRLKVDVVADAQTLTNRDETMSEFERKEFHHALRTVSLESEKYPTIKFVSLSFSDLERSDNKRSFKLTGDLTMHDQTKRITIPVKVTLGENELTATGETKLKQSDFSIKPFEKGFGLIKVADELTVNFHLTAKAQ
jgi:polyisoprenoid-binding protein YceI